MFDHIVIDGSVSRESWRKMGNWFNKVIVSMNKVPFFPSLAILGCICALLVMLSSGQALANEEAARADQRQQEAPLFILAQAATSKAQAANIAKARHGGKVLSVTKSGKGWRVKLLLDSGRVKMVYVDGAGSSN